VQKLGTIAQALGQERTRTELLPYIMDLMDDEEEVLIELSLVLNGKFLDLIGGPNYAPHMFKPLERLCEVEECTVRDKVCFANKSLIAHFRLLIALSKFWHR
jgi:serine/threonine-protein phosphatase 2A regulatory subunit A